MPGLPGDRGAGEARAHGAGLPAVSLQRPAVSGMSEKLNIPMRFPRSLIAEKIIGKVLRPVGLPDDGWFRPGPHHSHNRAGATDITLDLKGVLAAGVPQAIREASVLPAPQTAEDLNDGMQQARFSAGISAYEDNHLLGLGKVELKLPQAPVVREFKL